MAVLGFPGLLMGCPPCPQPGVQDPPAKLRSAQLVYLRLSPFSTGQHARSYSANFFFNTLTLWDVLGLLLIFSVPFPLTFLPQSQIRHLYCPQKRPTPRDFPAPTLHATRPVYQMAQRPCTEVIILQHALTRKQTVEDIQARGTAQSPGVGVQAPGPECL